MIKFTIYLIESGICLSLLYLAYWVLLRKETYFNFNRLYLVGSLFLALVVPLLHIGLILPENSRFYSTAQNIDKFQQSYTELIALLDADFGTEPEKVRHSGISGTTAVNSEFGLEPEQFQQQTEEKSDTRNRNVLPALLLFLYISGVIFFLTRLIYLVIRLSVLTKKNPVKFLDGFRLVEIKEDISPFSFFRFLFINSANFDPAELENVLEHERAHIMQKHSFDHLFAHALAIFQWFNPFAWRMRNALKTTHEFIADRQVIHKGYKLYDYQSLLLKQVIGYHSVELVNNFNLEPIKKRIIMMTKNKPGIPAKLKATLVIPFTVLAFLLFADFSLQGKVEMMNNDSGLLQNIQTDNLFGIWEKVSKDKQAEYVYFDKNGYDEVTVFVLNNQNDDRVYSSRIELKDGKILFNNLFSSNPVSYSLKNDKLVLSWDPNVETVYKRVAEDNILDHQLAKQNIKIDLPYLTQYKLIGNDIPHCDVIQTVSDYKSGSAYMNGQKVSVQDLGSLIKKEKAKYNVFDQDQFTVVFFIDKNVPMKDVIQSREAIRSTTLRFADAGLPNGKEHQISPLLFQRIALSRLMPPPDRTYEDLKYIESGGVKVLKIDLSERNTSPAELDRNITNHIKTYPEYVIALEYDGDIPYGQYIETVDMIFNIVYKFRNEMAMEKYGVSFGELGDALQKEVRRVYPMAMSEKMN